MADVDTALPLWSIACALIGGILPALFWLWFWLKEDRVHPEPRVRILLSFLGGMLAVILVYPLQKMACGHFDALSCGLAGYIPSTSTLFAWAVIEEMMKYLVIAVIALHSRDFDEPIDALEYLIITALGFAALENTLYILNPLLAGHSLQGLMSGNERFIGATLLHVVSSALIGYGVARGFYLSKIRKMGWKVIGIVLAISLHTLFNLFIIYENGNSRYLTFSIVWAMVLVVLLLFEKIKRIKAKS